MDASAIRIIDEYYASSGRISDPVLAAIEAALFAEDAFGVTIPEDMIRPDRLMDSEAMASLVDSLRSSNRGKTEGRGF